MIAIARTTTVAARFTQRGQKRGIVNWLTSYPDKVMAKKKIQMKGGTCLAEVNPTWWKQEGDAVPLAIGALLVGTGLANSVVGLYRLATGKGKLE